MARLSECSRISATRVLGRVDLAKKQVGLMQAADDDATLTRLAGAWLGLYEGGDKYQDALYEFQELGEKVCPEAT